MGLDMYAYCRNKQEGGFDDSREIAYWRKHPNLHGWMEKLWEERLDSEGKTPNESAWGSSFNGIELELTWADLDALEQDVMEGRLPATSGFFFGEGADDYYKKQDLEFIRNARAEMFSGLKVFYNSSW